jgi:putative transcriptional regulator
MTDVLDDKRDATRFRILTAIAERQPAVSQGEIADSVGVTAQAVSEYIRELDGDGFVTKEGRSRYRVTEEGVDWLLRSAADLQRFVDHVTDDVLGSVGEDAAIATAAIEEGERVSLTLDDGLLRATPGDAGPATGVATGTAGRDEVVGVTGFEGVIDLDPGTVTVQQVPPVRSGAVSSPEALAAACADADLVAAAGVEAVVALRDIDIDPVRFAAGAVAAAAAGRGLDCVVVVTSDRVGEVTDALRDGDVAYEVSSV